MVEEEEERRAAAGREREEAINTAREESIARLNQFRRENDERERSARDAAEEKEAKLVKESEGRVQKRICEQEALVDVLKKRQRKEEEKAEGAHGGSLPTAGHPSAPAMPECPVSSTIHNIRVDNCVEVCFEWLGPPAHVYQCGSGHLVCGDCKPKIQVSTGVTKSHRLMVFFFFYIYMQT